MADDKSGPGEIPGSEVATLRELLAGLSKQEMPEQMRPFLNSDDHSGETSAANAVTNSDRAASKLTQSDGLASLANNQPSAYALRPASGATMPPPIPAQAALRFPQALAPDAGTRSSTRPDIKDPVFQRQSPQSADFQRTSRPRHQRSLRQWWLPFVGGVFGTASLVIAGAFALGYFPLPPTTSFKPAALSDQVIEMLAARDRGAVLQTASSTSEPAPSTANAIAEKFSQSLLPTGADAEPKSTEPPAAGLTVAEAAPSSNPAALAQPVQVIAQATTNPAPASGGPAVRGVTANEIRFGISAPFSGPNKELGHHMRVGIEAAFNLTNAKGGVHNRQLKLISADDGYEPTRTALTIKQLYDTDQVFGFIGNVGTPTAAVSLPFSLERRMLFYSPFTGANLLRRDPPDRYVFNTRASYAEETEAAVKYLVKLRRLKPEQIAVFAQQDAFGDSGFAGVTKAMRSLRGGSEGQILRLNYKRNTLDIEDAVLRLSQNKPAIKAVVMIATYRAAAKFIGKVREYNAGMIFTNVSFVGSTALAEELMLMGSRYATGVIVTQVVPAVDGYSSVGLEYKAALTASFPGEAPDYVSFEGYLSAKLLIEALKRAGPQLDTEKVVEALETLRDYDIGLGATVTFSATEHQGLHKVWGTELDEEGHYTPIELQ